MMFGIPPNVLDIDPEPDEQPWLIGVMGRYHGSPALVVEQINEIEIDICSFEGKHPHKIRIRVSELEDI